MISPSSQNAPINPHVFLLVHASMLHPSSHCFKYRLIYRYIGRDTTILFKTKR